MTLCLQKTILSRGPVLTKAGTVLCCALVLITQVKMLHTFPDTPSSNYLSAAGFAYCLAGVCSSARLCHLERSELIFLQTASYCVTDGGFERDKTHFWRTLLRPHLKKCYRNNPPPPTSHPQPLPPPPPAKEEEEEEEKLLDLQPAHNENIKF